MNSIASAALSFLLLYKYIALFGIAYIAALFIPLPSSTSLIAAGAFSTQGYFNIFIVIPVALAANILGDLTGFFVSRKYGRAFLIKIGLKKVIESKKFIGLEEYISNRAGFTIFITRFITELGPLTNLFVGLSKIPFKKYFLYESLGETLYVLLFSSVGYFLGTQWQNSSSFVGFGITFLIVMSCIFTFGRSYFKNLRKDVQ